MAISHYYYYYLLWLCAKVSASINITHPSFMFIPFFVTLLYFIRLVLV